MTENSATLLDREVARPYSLRRNFSWTILGEVVYAGCQWGMVVVLAKLGTPELVGQFALGLAVTAPVFMLTNLQLRALQATEGAAGAGFAPFFTLRLLAAALALLVITGIAFLGGFSAATAAVIALTGAFKAVEAVSDICHGELQRRANMKWVCLSVALKGVLALAVLTLGIFWTHQLAPVCLAIAVVWLLVLLGVDVPLVARRFGDTDAPRRQTTFALCREWRPLQRLLAQALPLGLVAMLLSLNVSIPRYFLEGYWGDYELGVYSALAALMQASTLAAAALGTAASARLGTLYGTWEKHAWLRLVLELCMVSILFGVAGLVVAWLGGPALLNLFYGPAYAAHAESFGWLMLAAVGLNLCFILNWAVVAARCINAQLPLNLVLLLVTTVACWGLVPRFGLLGAALAVVVASAFQVLGTGFLLWRAVRPWLVEED